MARGRLSLGRLAQAVRSCSHHCCRRHGALSCCRSGGLCCSRCGHLWTGGTTPGDPPWRRWAGRLTMPVCGAAALLLLLTLVSQSQAPRRAREPFIDIGPHEPDQPQALSDNPGPASVEMTNANFRRKPERRHRKVDTWGHLRKIQRSIASRDHRDGVYMQGQ